jgi:hypothetical protein
MDKQVPPSEFCIDVIRTSRFEATTKRLGLPPSEVRRITRFVVDQAEQGTLFLSANGVALRTIVWDNKLTLIYGLNVEAAEIYLIDLVEDREPPSPPKKPNILKSLARKLAPTIAVAAGKKLIDWLIDHYASALQNEPWNEASRQYTSIEADIRIARPLIFSTGLTYFKSHLIHKNGMRATTSSRANANSLMHTQRTMTHARPLPWALGKAPSISSNQANMVAK